VGGGATELQTVELRNFYSLPSVSRMINLRWMGRIEHVARMGKRKEGTACRIMVRNTEGTKPLGRSRRRWVKNIKIDLRQD
jgi:hypothetical protein